MTKVDEQGQVKSRGLQVVDALCEVLVGELLDAFDFHQKAVIHNQIRRIRADEAEDAEKKLGRSLDEIFPKADYQIMHTLLFPHDVVHIENLGGQIDEVLDRKILFGCFPWRFQGGEAALCRAVAMLEE